MNTSPLRYRIDRIEQIDGSGSAAGSTPPRLLLLHPVGLDLTFFDPLVEPLSPPYQVLRPDLRGHGGSPSVQPAPALEDYADDIHALMARLEYAPAAVIGFSFGGMLAQVLALRHPQDVCALVISACPSTLSEQSRAALAERGTLAEREGMAAMLDSTLERWFSEPFLRDGACLARIRERLLSDKVRGWAEAWRAMSHMDTAAHLSSIAVPALCLAGERDQSAPPPIVEAIAKQIPGARFVVIPGAPHMLFIEQPQAVAAAISSFLSSSLTASHG